MSNSQRSTGPSSKPKQMRFWGKALMIKPKKMKEKTQSNYLTHRLTASMIRDYMNCPLLFYYRYIMKIRLPMKVMPLVFGGALHDALETFHNDGDPYKTFEEKFIFEEIDPKEGQSKDSLRTDFEEHGKEGKRFIDHYVNAQDYLKQYWKIDPKGRSEEGFNMVWWQDPATGKRLELPMNGRYDRLTDSHQIVEFKTSSKKYKQGDVDTLVQADVYNYTYFMQHGVIPEGMYYVVFIKGRKEPLQVLKTVRTKEQFSQIFRTADLVIKGIQGRQFSEGAGFLHKYCDCHKYKKNLLLV